MENHSQSSLASSVSHPALPMEVLNAIPTIIYVSHNATKTIRWCNQYFEKASGYSLQEMQAMGIEFFRAIMHPDDFHTALDARDSFQRNKEEFTGVCRMKGRHGRKWRWLYGIAVPFTYDEEGRINEVICNFLELKGMDTPAEMHKAFNWILQTELEGYLANLTPRERNILAMLMDHKKDDTVAEELFIEITTFKTHKKHIREKLGAANFELLIALSHTTGGVKLFSDFLKNHPQED